MKTTINIRIDNLRKIELAAKSMGISRSKMIACLLKKVMEERNDSVTLGKMVKYQKKRKISDWRISHVNFREDEYEYFTDLRKILKMSLSLILSDAVSHYLGKEGRIDISDNYRFINYTVIREEVDTIIHWRYIWGYPDDIILQQVL